MAAFHNRPIYGSDRLGLYRLKQVSVRPCMGGV